MDIRVRCVLSLLLLQSALCISPALAVSELRPDAPVVKLDDIGLYEVGYAYRGKPDVAFPDGWAGMFDEKSGISCLPAGRQNGKEALLLHCPWRGGTGIAYQQYHFRLPKVKRIILRGATAMRSDIVGQSDGVTFRVFANGRKLLDVNRKDSEWRSFQFDLTAYKGKRLTLRFETDPGPDGNSSFDFSLWGDRELVLDGMKAGALPSPAPAPLDLSKLWSSQTNTVSPLSAARAKTSASVVNGVGILRYDGADGAMEYRWERPSGSRYGVLGRIRLFARMAGLSSVDVPLAGSAELKWLSKATLKSSRWTASDPGTLTCSQTYAVDADVATVRITGRLVAKSIVFDVTCDRPWLGGLDTGKWGPTMYRRSVTVPYYSGEVSYLPTEGLFVNSYLDWTSSSATSHSGSQASYVALTDGSRACLKERIVYAASWHLAEALPNIPNPPSPYLSAVGDKIVLDTWGGRYTDIAASLEKLAAGGITKCVVIVHAWQRSGYDNALPAHIPAAADLGGDEGMKVLVETARRLGYIIALHENYVDYYPNYEGFDPKDIALDSAGERQLAWYNMGTKIQSFAVKPTAILRLAQSQSPEIHRRYGTNGDYLDVHSAVPPWFHVDQGAGVPGSGLFSTVWDAHKALWQFERDTHGGPVFGEGNSHWYWSGLLDGVEAQFGIGWPSNQGMSAPLMVDFDLLKIHPLQLNHGMGYYERWWNVAQWGSKPPMVVLDQYRMQEVAYGHAGFLGGANWDDLPSAWLEHHLMTPVTARYASAKPVEISYQINGKWLDGTAAAKARIWNRVRVRYDNGLTVYANGSESDMTVDGRTLPRFGWTAEGAGVTAGTTLRAGVMTDYAETADSVFANARSTKVWNISGIHRIRPTVVGFAQTGPRTVRFTYEWRVGEDVTSDYAPFVHFCDTKRTPSNDGIAFQQDHGLRTPTTEWRPGQTIPDGEHALEIPGNIADGSYDWMIGLVSRGGERLAIEGPVDGTGRIRLGTLNVQDGGKTVTFVPAKDDESDRQALYSADLNTDGKVIDFGTVRTDGSVLIRREGDEWVLRTMPASVRFELSLKSSRFPTPESVRRIGAGPGEASVSVDGDWWRLGLDGASEYRWKAE